jgi:hypothetical protein
MPPNCPICGHFIDHHSGIELWLCAMSMRYKWRDRLAFMQSVQMDIEEL